MCWQEENDSFSSSHTTQEEVDQAPTAATAAAPEAASSGEEPRAMLDADTARSSRMVARWRRGGRVGHGNHSEQRCTGGDKSHSMCKHGRRLQTKSVQVLAEGAIFYFRAWTCT